jgi:two-component system, LytTR family, response regulator
MNPLRTIVVDDEPLARKRLRRLLREHADVEIVSECGSGREAVKAIRQEHPDLVFLDVQMPGLDGFEVLTRVGVEQMPAVVFVTAFSEHAIRAFEVSALDFLLKPFDAERLATSLDRVRRQVSLKSANHAELYQRLLDAMGKADARPSYLSRLLVKSQGRALFLRTDEIDWIAAAGKYVRLYCGADYHLLRESISELERKLDPSQFRRIHRSTIVNLDAIREFQPLFHGELRAILRDGTELTVSRRYRPRLEGQADGCS